MRGTTARLALGTAGLAVLGLVGGAGAAAPAAAGPKTLVVTDAAGDKLGGTNGDIVKVTYTTTGLKGVKKVGKKSVPTYTAKNLVIRLEMADAIDTKGTTEYEVDADLADCNSFNVYYTPGVDGSEGAGCSTGAIGSSSSTGVDVPVINGKTITWTIPFSSVPGVLKAGASIDGISAFTALVDPVTGFVGPYFVGPANDDASTDTAYKVG